MNHQRDEGFIQQDGAPSSFSLIGGLALSLILALDHLHRALGGNHTADESIQAFFQFGKASFLSGFGGVFMQHGDEMDREG